MSTRGVVTVSSPTHSSAVAGTVATPSPAAGTTAPTATPVQAHGASPAPSAEAKRPSNFRKTYYHHLNVGTKGGKGVDAAAFSGGDAPPQPVLTPLTRQLGRRWIRVRQTL